MSKAFLRESDFADLPDLPPPAALLPVGAKNYLTAGGHRRLRAELERLTELERPPLAASAGADVDAKRELQALDHRIRHLQHSLRTAEVVAPPTENRDVVRFGATVVVADESGAKSQYRLVGLDETAPERGWVSWLSPLARALLNVRQGETVSFKSPSSVKKLTVVSIDYEPDA